MIPETSSTVSRPPMKITLEDFTRYDRSLLWRLHDAWFAARGIAAWTAGDVPYHATSNLPFARQCARLVTALVRELEVAGTLGGDEPVWVLEAGSGLGLFASSFLAALAEGDGGGDGPALLKRIRYVLSDYSEASVRQAIDGASSPALAGHVAAGRVVPALFDVRKPGELRGLDGRVIEAQLVATIANYICCVTPQRVIRKQGDQWLEKEVRVVAELPDDDPALAPLGRELVKKLLGDPTRENLLRDLHVEARFVPAPLGESLSDPRLAESIAKTLADKQGAILHVPEIFAAFLAATGALGKRGSLVLVNDYGACASDEISDVDSAPQHYGNTLNQGVDFPLFDALAEAMGWQIERTAVETRRLHSMAVRFGLTQADAGRLSDFRAEFRRLFSEVAPGEDLLDFGAAARLHAKTGEHVQAVRMYERAQQLLTEAEAAPVAPPMD